LALDITELAKRKKSDDDVINWSWESPPCYRGLSIKRIIKAKEMHETFDYGDTDIPLLMKELLQGRIGTIGIEKDPEMIPVQLRISPDAAGVIRDYQWGLRQLVKDRGKKGIELSFFAPLNEDLISWILSLGSEVEVIQPAELRTKIRDEVLKLRYMYEQE
jgi:proteasome accessory factor B